jgi:hypothetical protein
LRIKTFAETHRLNIALDTDNTVIIRGKSGQIFEYDNARLGVMYQPAKDAWKPKTWGNNRRAALAAGMELHQDGDSEGTLLFDPANVQQSKLAVKIAHCRAKRVLSPEQLETLRQRAALMNTARYAIA